MKRTVFLFLLIGALLFGACGKRAPAPSVQALAEAVCAALDAETTASRLDEEAVSLDFGEIPDVREAAVYTVETPAGTGEFGVFSVGHDARGAAREALLALLNEKAEASAALASLYPGEKSLYEKTAFEGALAGLQGDVLYYFALDRVRAEACLAALRAKLK